MKKLVIIPGGFHPFHAGHKALYDAAVAAFPSAEVYVAATADTSNRPFPIEAKKKLARLAGIPQNRFIQVKSPFRAEEITQHYDPNDTVLIFARSDKDTDSQPRPGGVKKDGTPAYLQPYKRNNLEPMSRHGYMVYLPTVQFGPGMTSATEIRAKWPGMTPEQKAKLVNTLYPQTQGNDRLTGVTVKLLDTVLGQQVDEMLPALGAMLGGELAASAGAGEIGTMLGRAAGDYVGTEVEKSLSSDDETVDEAWMKNDPDAGPIIYPDGGMGSYDEATLISSFSRDMARVLEMIKGRNFSGAYYTLFDKHSPAQSKLRALAQYEKFKTKQGRRPIARGREIDLAQDYVDESGNSNASK